jgi:hypothetical protein
LRVTGVVQIQRKTDAGGRRAQGPIRPVGSHRRRKRHLDGLTNGFIPQAL